MRNFVKYCIKRAISLLLHVFWIFPIRGNEILFINDHSYTYSDNLKYLAEYLVESSSSYSIFFSLKETEGMEDKRIIPIRYLSLRHFFHAIVAGTVITNDSGIVYLPIRKKQLVINTWHGGGPYKVTGVGALDNYWYRKDLKYNASKVDYILSSCEAFTEEEAPGMLYDRNQCINCGMPRIDVFFDNEAKKKARKKVIECFSIPDTDRIVLYAPTFRGFIEDYKGVVRNSFLEIDYNRVVETLSERFGGDWKFAVRLHPKLKNIQISDRSIINMSLYPDSEELLLAVDVLITDYSSVMWDFSFSDKPCFVFATDINDYETVRGFYLPPSEWPYPLAETNDELIRNIKGFDQKTYCDAIREHHSNTKSYENGCSRKSVKSLIDKHI